MGADLWRLEFHLVKRNLNRDEVDFLLDYQVEDGTYYLDNDMVETAIKEEVEIPPGIMQLYQSGVFEEGLSFIISH